MRIPIYQIDAFTGRLFGGNPAAVCPLASWLEDAQMQAIAAENNLSETAFLVERASRYQLRWFTPKVEIDLCGHATLAAAYAVFNYLKPSADSVVFETRSGELTVRREGDLLAMDFPVRPAERCEAPRGLPEALGKPPLETWKAHYYMALYENEQDVRGLEPDMSALARVDMFAVIVTAPARQADFVSRFFAPAAGIAEDPVTGSAHCTLVPYWAERLAKTRLHALQVSERGGELDCELRGDRVILRGRAVPYLEGTIRL